MPDDFHFLVALVARKPHLESDLCTGKNGSNFRVRAIVERAAATAKVRGGEVV